MSYKSILVHVDTDNACAERLRVAVALAGQHAAHLSGLHVRPEITLPAPVLAGYADMVSQIRERYLAEIATKARKIFDHAVGQAEISSEWRDQTGRLCPTVSTHGRYADLIVLGQPGPDVEDEEEIAPLIEEVALRTGRPVLAVPFAGTFPSVGKRVAIAWDAGREATRAVVDAMPFLRQAKEVHILCVNAKPSETGHGADVGADIALYLARHGVNAISENRMVCDIDTSDVLLSFIADRDVDLLVMGAYGHSRLAELVLGGVTRHMLREMTVPILFSH